MVPDVVIRLIIFLLVNHSAPSDPTVMPSGSEMSLLV